MVHNQACVKTVLSNSQEVLAGEKDDFVPNNKNSQHIF